MVWLRWGEPAQWIVTDNGRAMSEVASTGRFDVVATFSFIGLALGFVGGSILQFVDGRRSFGLRWALPAVAVVGALLAAIVTWRVGVAFGPPSPKSVEDVATGQHVSESFAVSGVAPFMAWAFAAACGAATVLWMRSAGESADPDADTSTEISAEFTDEQSR
jgi:hypothetical protein